MFSHFHLPCSRLTLNLAQMVLDLPRSNFVGPGAFRPDIRHQQSNCSVQIITLQLRRGIYPTLRPQQAPFRGRIPGHNRRNAQGSRPDGMAAEKGESHHSCSTHWREYLQAACTGRSRRGRPHVRNLMLQNRRSGLPGQREAAVHPQFVLQRRSQTAHAENER